MVPSAFSLRLLYPFLLKNDFNESCAQALLAYQPEGESQPIWNKCSELHTLYLTETLRETVQFLFPSPDLTSCFTLHPAVCDRWFRPTTAVVLNGQKESAWRKKNSPDASGRPASIALSLDRDYSIELFILHNRVGLLSIPFRNPLRTAPNQPSSLTDLKDCFYHLSHTKFRVPVFRIPHPATDPAWAPPGEQPFDEELTLSDPLPLRLGKPGQPFCLAELRDLLLSPLTSAAEFLPEQNQFLTHSVVSFPLTVDLGDPDTRRQLCPELASFAQLEESGHPLAPSDNLGIPCDVLSAKHAAAFAYLGATHFVADQYPPGESHNKFDAVRIQQIQRKYFTAYLVSLTQRLLAHRFLEDAVRVRRHAADIATLWNSFCTFEASAQLIDVSRREAVNRAYRLAQSAQRVPDTLASLHRVFRDVQATEAATRQHILQQHQEATRHRLGLIEIFIVTVYTAELTHIIGEVKHFDPNYLLAGMLGFSALAAYLVYRYHHTVTHLRPAANQSKTSQWMMWTLLILAILLFLAWVAGGHLYHPDKLDL